jgi:hypothetical protein
MVMGNSNSRDEDHNEDPSILPLILESNDDYSLILETNDHSRAICELRQGLNALTKLMKRPNQYIDFESYDAVMLIFIMRSRKIFFHLLAIQTIYHIVSYILFKPVKYQLNTRNNSLEYFEYGWTLRNRNILCFEFQTRIWIPKQTYVSMLQALKTERFHDRFHDRYIGLKRRKTESLILWKWIRKNDLDLMSRIVGKYNEKIENDRVERIIQDFNARMKN